MSRSQVSLEYLIITGFIVFAILVPTFLIVFSSASKGVTDKVTNQKVVDLGKGLVDDATQMYYLGVYSRKTAEYDIPDNVESLYVMDISDGSKDYYYLGITLFDGKKRVVQTFQSDVPMTSTVSEETQDYVEHITNSDDPPGKYIPECHTEGYTCDFYTFTGNAIKPGMKKFKIETVMRDSVVKSEIVPVLE